jgi:hypothetical protein
MAARHPQQEKELRRRPLRWQRRRRTAARHPQQEKELRRRPLRWQRRRRTAARHPQQEKELPSAAPSVATAATTMVAARHPQPAAAVAATAAAPAARATRWMRHSFNSWDEALVIRCAQDRRDMDRYLPITATSSIPGMRALVVHRTGATWIATYHYSGIFDSWDEALVVSKKGDYTVTPHRFSFNECHI